MSNKTEALLVESAKQSLNKILEKSNISKWIKFSQIPSKISGNKVAPNYIDSYGCVKFGSSDNPWNMLGINVFVKKGNGDKKDSSNPRKIQFRLIADYAKEAKDKGAKFALMEEICRRSNNKASIASGKKHGVYCLESDAIEVANCIADIMSESKKQFFANYDENDKETKSRVFVNHDEFLNEAFSADTTNKNVVGVLLPEKETVSVTLYKRDSLVVAETLRLANGYCELCELKSPFKTKSGRDYLEVHHVIPLSKQGSDTVSNTVALCPNCHRMLHFGDNAEDMMAKLNKIKRLDCFK
ncbi:HNH endonuclease [Photobacterium leiognathi]|uniref:HNH endonuclease n=1 Tax=Photobacterium leiognathi TaxID=553611 RepID=UPI0029812A29|nr:HNH endonuclease [Photobacterium leiognathi]